MTKVQLSAISFLGLALVAGWVAYGVTSSRKPEEQTFELPESYGPAPEFRFPSAYGGEVGLTDFSGKVWIADFFFTNCKGICPKLTSSMKRVQAETEDLPELKLVSFSVDPARDNAETLSKYADSIPADRSRWSFLFGKRGEVKRLSTTGFNLGATEVPGEILHSDRLILIDRQGQIRGYFSGTHDSEVNDLIQAARKLVKDGS